VHCDSLIRWFRRGLSTGAVVGVVVTAITRVSMERLESWAFWLVVSLLVVGYTAFVAYYPHYKVVRAASTSFWRETDEHDRLDGT